MTDPSTPSPQTPDAGEHFAQLTVYNRPVGQLRRLSFHIRHNGVIFGKGKPGPVRVEVYLEARAATNQVFAQPRLIDTYSYSAGQFTFTLLNHLANQLQQRHAV